VVDLLLLSCNYDELDEKVLMIEIEEQLSYVLLRAATANIIIGYAIIIAIM
jgi:hypothetical protein